MALKDNELARRDAGVMECRSEPLRVSWTLVDLSSNDSHTLDCRFSCSVRIADTTSDRRMFAEVFATHESVDADALARHFARAIRTAVSSLALHSMAEDVVGGTLPQHQEWIKAIREAANPVGFASGLELLAPFQLDVESPTLQRQRLEEIARARAEARTAGQVQHLQRASELLTQFQSLRQAAPDLPAGKLLEQINASERGATLQTLLLASSQKSAASKIFLYAVSGNSLVQIDAQTVPPRMKLIPLPADLGPLRSVQPAVVDAMPSLLIGARGGVMLIAPEAPTDVRMYSVPNLESQLGFNAAICTDCEIWATHAEAGVVSWRLAHPGAANEVYSEAPVQNSEVPADASNASILVSGSLRCGSPATGRISGARNLVPLDGSTLAYTVGNAIVVRDHQSRMAFPPQSTSEIVALIPAVRSVIAVHHDGTIAIIDRALRSVVDVLKRGGRFTAAGMLPWLGDLRLLLASEEGPIDCIGLDDPLVTEYLSPYRGLKILSATSDLIAAVSPDRQRIIIWNNWDGQRPAGEIHVTAQTRHRIADIEFGG